MQTQKIMLPTTHSLFRDYVEGSGDAADYFCYRPYDLNSYRKRLEYLASRSYPHRDELANGLLSYNRQIGNHDRALQNIERLRNPETYVVVAGQQAGVLTGPLYTIHKAIHLIQMARLAERELGVSVVPVFWIAGEDHDWDEANHIHGLTHDGRVEKWKISVRKEGKPSVSMLPVDEEAMIRFTEQVLAVHEETEYTKEMREFLLTAAKGSCTLVDWFAKCMVQFFGKHGLVMLESSSPFVRELEQPVFRKVVEENSIVARLLQQTEDRIKTSGYQAQLALDPQSAHLFIYRNGERLLLERTSEGFQTKGRPYTFSQGELLQLIDQEPQLFSASVITRPLMQEHLLPTLAFIGGPGEIAYWAYFKEYFSHMGYQLPICLPRTSVTLVDLAVARKMEQLSLPIETVLGGFLEWKQNYLQSLDDEGFHNRFESMKQDVLRLYQPLADDVVSYDQGLIELTQKNVNNLLEQIQFLQRRAQRSVLEKHSVAVQRISRIEANLVPNGRLQERVLSIITFANKHGLDLVDRLVEQPYTLANGHQIVYL